MELATHSIGSGHLAFTERCLNILIVEDVPEDVELIALTLSSNEIPFTFDSVASAAEVRQYLSTHHYDVVLSDYSLAQFNGLQAFEVLQESGQEIPFILVTGSLGEEAAVECIKAGMTDYVLKERLFRLPTVLARALNEFELRRQQLLAINMIQRQARREAVVNRIVQAMRETLIVETVLQTTVDQLHEVLEISRCSIFQPDPEQAEKAVISYISKSTQREEKLLGISTGLYNYYQTSLMRERAALIQQLEDLPEVLRQEAKAEEISSSLLMPLLYQNRYLGGICLQQCSHSRHWTEDDLAIAKTISDQCAIAIHQALLYQQAQKELAERQRIEAKLRHDAFHDALTGLPNRALFTDRLDHALQLAKRRCQGSSPEKNCRFAVLFLDLDRFKVVNDSLGHSIGDQLLQKVAQQLKMSVRKCDTIARLGGDEFVILLEDLKSADEAIDVATRIHHQLKLPIQLGEEEIFVTTSVGIALNSELYTSSEQILRDADIAMYRAKRGGRGCYEVFNSSMHAVALTQLHLENDLQRALERDEFRVYYQPILNLQTLQIEGLEALIRWQHPETGMIAPSEFIPVAEETGLITEIDLWVLKEAAHQMLLWQQELPHLSELALSVNLSGKHFSRGRLVSQIDEILLLSGMRPANLRIEITEGVLIDNAVIAAQVLGELRSRKIRVCLDDFGTQYSSLSYLHRFPINCLKVDKLFIASLEEDLDKREIVKAIIGLALNLQMSVVAEGIESASQLEFLQSIDCHAGQGYYFSPPLNSSATSELLRSGHLC